jgi:pimeloyl-ACP methyl ester carboxylesterase
MRSSSTSSHFLDVDGIRTHYLEAGAGPTVVLLHGGEFGGCAELSWEFTTGPLGEHFHVIAPDWLGYGHTDKIHDFGQAEARRVKHLARFLELKGLSNAHFIGNSMGGSVLSRALAKNSEIVSAKSLTLISGGGFAPDNEWRRMLTSYDCTREGMRNILKALFHDQTWANNDEYLERRYQMSLINGAWECAAASRFKSPATPPRQEFGRSDETPYENIRIPVLLIAGAADKLRNPGYATEVANKLPIAKVHIIPDAGHCPQIERPGVVNPIIIQFIDALERST